MFATTAFWCAGSTDLSPTLLSLTTTPSSTHSPATASALVTHSSLATPPSCVLLPPLMFMPVRCPNAPLTLRLRLPNSRFHPIQISVYNRPCDPIVAAQFQPHQRPPPLRQRLHPAVAAPSFRHSRCFPGSILPRHGPILTIRYLYSLKLNLLSSIRLCRSYFLRPSSPHLPVNNSTIA